MKYASVTLLRRLRRRYRAKIHFVLFILAMHHARRVRQTRARESERERGASWRAEVAAKRDFRFSEAAQGACGGMKLALTLERAGACKVKADRDESRRWWWGVGGGKRASEGLAGPCGGCESSSRREQSDGYPVSPPSRGRGTKGERRIIYLSLARHCALSLSLSLRSNTKDTNSLAELIRRGESEFLPPSRGASAPRRFFNPFFIPLSLSLSLSGP